MEAIESRDWDPKTIKTIKDLRKIITDLSDDTPVYMYYADTAYNICGGYINLKCIEQNGRRHEKEGFFLELD